MNVVRERGPYDTREEAKPVYDFTMREYKNDATVRVRMQKRGSGKWWVVAIRGKQGKYL
jgi:hypothetical protein